MNALYTTLFILIVLIAGGIIAYKVVEKKRLIASMKWLVPNALLDSILLEAEKEMNATGYAEADYVLNVHDCSDYAPVWKEQIQKRLKPFRPDGELEWMKLFSFKRDPRADGSEPGRHRVVAIKTVDGLRFVDTYRINGSLYRTLSEAEQKNGYYI